MRTLLLIGMLFFSGCSYQIRVVVLDSGLNLQDTRFNHLLCKEEHKDFTNKGIKDVNGHGTFVAGLIRKYAENSSYCLIIVKYYHPGMTNEQLDNSVRKSYRYIDNIKPDIVNYSGVGYAYLEEENYTLLNNPKTLFITAAGNNGLDLGQHIIFPAQFPYFNVWVVGNIDNNGKRYFSSNYGNRITHWEVGVNIESSCIQELETCVMTGTSFSTAIVTGKTIKSLDEYFNN